MNTLLLLLLSIWSGLALSTETISCPPHQLLFEMETYYREGNDERPCPVTDDYPRAGTEFITFNAQGVAMFSSGTSRDYCQGLLATAPSPAIFHGCVDKSHISKGVNHIHINMANISDQTYVNEQTRVYLILGSSKIFVTDFSRQGKGADQIFSGLRDLELSGFILSESGLESAQHLRNIQFILGRLKDLQILSSKDLESMSAALAPYLDMDARHIDIASLGESVPAWFKDLLKEIQLGQEKLERDLEDESKKIDEAQNTNQKKIAAALDSLNAQISDEELSEELKLEDTEYEDEQLIQREQNWLAKFQVDIEGNDRVTFLQDIYSWESESKVSLDIAIKLNAKSPGYYSAFVSSQERILAFIRKFIDENGYFRDVPISDEFKILIESTLKLKNPELARKIKDSVNLKSKKSAVTDKAWAHLEMAASEYAKGADTLTEGAQTTLIHDILSFIEVAQTVVDCLAKTHAAGLYASFFEVFEGQNFCDGSELNAFDRTISFVDFSADVSSKLGVTWASSISVAVNMKKMLGIASPLFRKLGGQKLAEIGKLILNIADDIKIDSMENVLSKIKKRFNSAKKFGIKTPTGLKAFAKIEGAIESLPGILKVQRIREGSDAGKVAIIGRSMGNAEEGLVGVRDAASHLKSKGIKPSTFEPSTAANSSWEKAVERYRKEIGNPNAYLPDDIVRTTDLYKENVSWVNKLKEEGYTVLDIGNPNNLSSPSIFYEMEKSILF